MISQMKIAFVAAVLVGSVSTALAVDVTANADRAQSSYYQAAPGYAQAPFHEGRNGSWYGHR